MDNPERGCVGEYDGIRKQHRAHEESQVSQKPLKVIVSKVGNSWHWRLVYGDALLSECESLLPSLTACAEEIAAIRLTSLITVGLEGVGELRTPAEWDWE